jgi:hypothetical protein
LYKLIVIPEWEHLEKPFIADLLAYVRGGGKLLVIGPTAAAMFQEELGFAPDGPAEQRDCWVEHKGFLGGMVTRCRKVSLKKGVKAFGRLFLSNDPHGASQVAASIAKYGKGRIAAVYFDFGDRYMQGTTFAARGFLNALVRELFPNPIVEVSGSSFVDVSANHLGDKLAINLVNTAGPHDMKDRLVFDEIPPVGPLEITIRAAKRPKKITLQPAGKKVQFKYSAGKIMLVLPRLEIHDILIVD